MLTIDFKECCRECGYIDLKENSYSLVDFTGNQKADLTIGCKHQKVCKEYRDQPESKRLVKS